MHVPNKSQVIFISTRLAYCGAPFLYKRQDSSLYSSRSNGGPFGKSSHQFVQKLLGADLQVERITTVLDAYVKQAERQEGNVWISVIDVIYDGGSSFTRRCAFLAVDQVGHLEVQR